MNAMPPPIDPEVRKVLPDDFIVDNQSAKKKRPVFTGGPPPVRAYDENPATWQRVHEMLTEKYPVMEK
jgi:hypothetical protein